MLSLFCIGLYEYANSINDVNWNNILQSYNHHINIVLPDRIFNIIVDPFKYKFKFEKNIY